MKHSAAVILIGCWQARLRERLRAADTQQPRVVGNVVFMGDKSEPAPVRAWFTGEALLLVFYGVGLKSPLSYLLVTFPYPRNFLSASYLLCFSLLKNFPAHVKL